MSWAGKPDESTLPSTLESTTPRQDNTDPNKNHHTHHNNLADAVKELVTQVDDAIGSNGSLAEALSGSNITTYVTVAETANSGERAGRDPQATIDDTLQSSMLPGYQLNAGNKIIVFAETAELSGIYTVGTGPSYTWVRQATQPAAGSFIAAGPKSALAGTTYMVNQEGEFIEISGTRNSLDAQNVLFSNQVDQFDGGLPANPSVSQALNYLGTQVSKRYEVMGATILIPGYIDSGRNSYINDITNPNGGERLVENLFDFGDKILVAAYLDVEQSIVDYELTGIYTVGSAPGYAWTRDTDQPYPATDQFVGDRVYIFGEDQWYGQYSEIIAYAYGGGTAYFPSHLNGTLQIVSDFIGEYYDSTIQRTSGKFVTGATAVVNSLVQRGEAPTITGWYEQDLELFVADSGHTMLTNAELDAASVLAYADGSAGGFIRDLRGQLWNANFSASETSSFLKVVSGRFTLEGVKVITVDNLPSGFLGSGGPIVDFGDGTGMMILHVEGDSYQKLCAAKVVCDEYGPVSITYVGDLITPEITQPAAAALEITAFQGAGIFIEEDGYIYTYFPDWLSDGTYVETCVARCLKSDIVTAIGDDEAPTFLKWDGAGYTQPGLGGTPTGITDGPRGSGDFIQLPDGRWLFVTTDAYSPTDWRIISRFADNPETWSDYTTLLEGDGNEWIYGTLWSGDPANPKTVTRDHVLFLWTVADDPGARWDTNRIQQIEVRPRKAVPAPDVPPQQFEVALAATVFDGTLAGDAPTIYQPNGSFASASTSLLVEDDKILVTYYLDGSPDLSKTGIYTVGAAPTFEWTRDAVQPRYPTNDFTGDVVRTGLSTFDNGSMWFGRYISTIGGDDWVVYSSPAGNQPSTAAALAIGESFDTSTGSFSDQFDSGAVALVNSVLSDEVAGLPFTPTTSGDWTTSPTNVQEALDELASRIAALEGP